MKDLFGEIHPVVKHRVKGYAAAPGSGPAGETCKTCRHHVIIQIKNIYHKCGLVHWTAGAKTDIRLKSPACRRWEEK